MKFRRKKFNISINKIFNKKSLPILILVSVLVLSIGYSAYSSTINITGIVGEVRAVKDVRITGVSETNNKTLEGHSNSGSVFDLEYGINDIKARVIIDGPNAMQVLAITVTNFGNEEVGILSVNGLPSELNYEFIDYNEKEKICDVNDACTNGITKEIYLAIYGNAGMYNIDIEIEFEPFFDITYTGINGNYPNSILGGDTLEIDFGNNPPGSLIITMGQTQLTKNIDYAYVNGVLTLPNVTDNINIGQLVYTLKPNFSDLISTLSGNTSYASNRTIKTIRFYSNGNLPEGYTLEQLELLGKNGNSGGSVDVSNSGNKKIMAYHDGDGNIYIYSEGQIAMIGSAADMFMYYYNLTLIDLTDVDTTSVTSMSRMFYNCQSLRNVYISGINTSNVSNMNSMFRNCYSLSYIDSLDIDVHNVVDFGAMFQNTSLTNLDLSHFNTSSAKSMSLMFRDCSSLTSLDLSSFTTSSVTNMSYMFSGCSSLTSLDLSSFTTSSVTNMSSMFSRCSSLTSLDLSGFTVPLVQNMSYMFSDCSGLTSLDLSSFTTSSVTDMSYMFYECSKLTSIDLSNLDTSQVTNVSYLFEDSRLLSSIDLRSAELDSVTNASRMLVRVPTSVRIYLKDTQANRNFMSTNFASYTPTYITPSSE